MPTSRGKSSLEAARALMATPEPTPSHNLNDASPEPPRVNAHGRRAPHSRDHSSTNSRPAIPLELPDKSPVHSPIRQVDNQLAASADGSDAGSSPPASRRKKKAARKTAVGKTNGIAAPAKKSRKQLRKNLSPPEINAGADPKRLADTLSLADKKAQAIEAWRAAGAAVQDAAQRQFTAMKLAHMDEPATSRKRKVAETSVRIAPVAIPFAKELFSLSVNSLLPKLSEKESQPIVCTTTPKRRRAPAERLVDAEHPGFIHYAVEQRLAFADRLKAAPAAEGEGDEGSVEGAQVLTDDELLKQWEALADDERERHRSIEADESAHHERQVAAYEKDQEEPSTGYHIKLREPAAAKKLLLLPSEWRAYEFVSFAGHRVQNALVSQVSLDYHVPTEKLTLRCKVGLGSSEKGALSA